MTFALVGNPNCGKTSLFNLLTGAKAKVANLPGVTVSPSVAALKAHPDIELVLIRTNIDEADIEALELAAGGRPEQLIAATQAGHPHRVYRATPIQRLADPAGKLEKNRSASPKPQHGADSLAAIYFKGVHQH